MRATLTKKISLLLAILLIAIILPLQALAETYYPGETAVFTFSSDVGYMTWGINQGDTHNPYAPWTMSTDDNWIHLSVSSGSSPSKCHITIDANTTGRERIGWIYNTFIGAGVVKIKIIQSAGYYLTVDQGHINGLEAWAGGGQGATINVSSNTIWSVSCSDNWFHVSNSGGDGNGSFTVYVDANPGAERTGYITVASPVCPAITIRVHQQAAEGFMPECEHTYGSAYYALAPEAAHLLAKYEGGEAVEDKVIDQDEDAHTLLSPWLYECTLCGHVKLEKTEREEDHDFSGNKCDVCGYKKPVDPSENACPECGSTEYDDKYVSTIDLYPNNDGNTHTHTYWANRTCEDCGHVWDKVTVPEAIETHAFNTTKIYKYDENGHWLHTTRKCGCGFNGYSSDSKPVAHTTEKQYEKIEYHPDINTHTVITSTISACLCEYESVIDIKSEISGHVDNDNDGNCDLCSGQAENLLPVYIDGVQTTGGEIMPNGSFVISGNLIRDKLVIEIHGHDVTNSASITSSANQTTVSPGSRLWDPNAELGVWYDGKQLAKFKVDDIYSEVYVGKKLIDGSENFSVGYAFTFEKGGEVIASFCSDRKYVSLHRGRVTYDSEDTVISDKFVYTDNINQKEIKLYGTCEAGTTVYVWCWFDGTEKYPHIYCEYEQYPSRTGDPVVLEHNGEVVCEVELYEQDKPIADLNEWEIERIRLGIEQGFQSIKTVYGDAKFKELIAILKKRNGVNNPIKVYAVDTDIGIKGKTAGMNSGDLGIIYLNSDKFLAPSLTGLSNVVAHEFQHYCFALVANNSSFINESFSETVGISTAERLSNWSGEYGDLYTSRDVIGDLRKYRTEYTNQNDSNPNDIFPSDGIAAICGNYDSTSNTFEGGLLQTTSAPADKYALYSAFGYYLQNRSASNNGLQYHLSGGMSGLLDLIAEETEIANKTDGDHLNATFRALYKGFTGKDGTTQEATAYFMNDLMPDFQTYISNCMNVGQMQ